METVSRRDLFKKFLPKKADLPEKSELDPMGFQLNRRDLFKLGAAIVTAAAINKFIPEKIVKAEESEELIEEQNISQPEENSSSKQTDWLALAPYVAADAGISYLTTRSSVRQKFSDFSTGWMNDLGFNIEQDSYKNTIAQSLMLIPTSIVLSSLLTIGRVENGNKGLEDARMQDFMKNKPYQYLATGAILAPLIEETLFRVVPSLVVDGIKREDPRSSHRSESWGFGIPVSVIFGLLHNQESNGKFAASLPLTQSLMGLYFWNLARDRGYLHSYLSHGVYNGGAISLSLLLSQ